MLRTWAIPAAMLRRPLVVHWRGTYRTSMSVNAGLRAATRIIAISRANAELLPPFARGKTDIVLNPFKPSLAADERRAARRRIREKLRLPEGAAVVGFFGNLIDRKRPHVLIDIVGAVPETSSGAPVYGLLCGGRAEPVDHRLDERRAASPVSERIIEAGHVDKPEEWMSACDVVILPAIDEPFGRVAIEAQGVGVPVLVSTQCGASEVIEDGISGFVLDAYDQDGWIGRVRSILDDDALATRLIEGGRKVATRLSVDDHVASVERIYDRVTAPASFAR
jgi:glycosyltransferase involved in cell wall biosynthesis